MALPPVDPHRIGANSPAEPLDVAIARIAGEQEGVIGHGQLRAAGGGRGAIRLRVERRRLNRIFPGVYAVGHRAVSLDGRRLAAVLSVGPDAALSHGPAGALWEVCRWSGRLEVTTPRDVRRRGIRVHSQPLPEDEVRVVRGIRVTSPPRTLLDLAGVLNRRRLERAFEQALVLRLDDELSLSQLLERYPRRPGSPRLRELLGRVDLGAEVTRFELERRFRDLVRDHGLPRPRLNLVVEGFEVDCVWRRARVVVELDGRAFHSNAFAFERDRERDRVLAAAGWLVIRITWRQLTDDPGRVAADLRAVLAARR